MSNTREILTFQFGNYANHIGAHWWNIQESGFSYDKQSTPTEINNDVLYRQGKNQNRITTYTPRLLLVDLDGALKHLPTEGELYGNCVKRTTTAADPVKKLKDDLDWKDTDIEVVAQPEIPRHAFQSDLDDVSVNYADKQYQLADSVDTWADFAYARYHPRTVNIIKDYKYSTEKQTFDSYACGAQLWKTEQFQDDFCDRIRQYVEECDYMQGFQTIFDCFNGYSGLATKCMEYLSEEYTKAHFAVPVFSPKSVLYENADEAMSDSIRVINSALAFNALIEQSSLFVPLSTQDRVWRQFGNARQFPGLTYRADNLYQTSAILAAYLDTISLRFRLRDALSANSLAGFCGDLTNYGRKMAAAALALPFGMQHDVDLIDCLDKWEGPLYTQLTPNCTVGNNYIVQSLCVRGIAGARLKRPREHEQAKRQMRMAAYKCDSVSQMFQLYLQCAQHASMAHVSSVTAAMPTRLPFPGELFDERLTTDGFISPFSKRTPEQKVNGVPTLAAIQSSSELGDTLETLHREAKRVKIAKLHRYTAAGMEQDDYEAALENLLLFKDNYEDNFEL